eukprot:1592671-Pyramimonas_sp.AAC.1
MHDGRPGIAGVALSRHHRGSAWGERLAVAVNTPERNVQLLTQARDISYSLHEYQLNLQGDSTKPNRVPERGRYARRSCRHSR